VGKGKEHKDLICWFGTQLVGRLEMIRIFWS